MNAFTKVRLCCLGLVESVARALLRPLARRYLTRDVQDRLDSFDIRHEASETSYAAIDALAEALNLIRQHDPLRYNRIAKDMPVIWLSATKPHYLIDLGVCVLPVKQVLEEHVSRTAFILVHEATHARIFKAGIGWWPTIEGRIERMCLKEEGRFATRLEQAGFVGVDEYRIWLGKAREALPG